MSLINDALKRASGTKPRPPGSDGAAPLQPVQESSRGPGALPLVLCLVGIGALLVSGAFWLKSHGTATQVATGKQSSAPSISAEQPAPKPLIVAELPRVQAAAPVAAPAETPAIASTSKPVEVNAAVPVPVPATPPPANIIPAETPAPRPKPPELKLQAIYYRMRGPTVLINGKTLKVGDMIDGAKLVSIERSYVEVEVQGTRRKLTLK